MVLKYVWKYHLCNFCSLIDRLMIIKSPFLTPWRRIHITRSCSFLDTDFEWCEKQIRPALPNIFHHFSWSSENIFEIVPMRMRWYEKFSSLLNKVAASGPRRQAVGQEARHQRGQATDPLQLHTQAHRTIQSQYIFISCLPGTYLWDYLFFEGL